MADKQDGGESESFKLRAEIVGLASKRLEAISSKSKEEKILKILDKRRRKWRKRHGLHRDKPCRALDPSLREEKESLSDELVELRSVLLRTRKEGFALARQLREERDTLCAQVITSRLESARERLTFSKNCNRKGTQLIAAQQSPVPTPQEKIITDLQDTISHATTLVEIKGMKFGMTPRVPPLHRRTLNNPLEQSLGLFDNDGQLQASSLASEVDDCSTEELGVVGVGKSWASYEGLVTGSNSNGLRSLDHKTDTFVEDASLDRKGLLPEPRSSKQDELLWEESLAYDLQSQSIKQDVLLCGKAFTHDPHVQEQDPAVAQLVEGTVEGIREQDPAVAQLVEGTVEGMSCVATLSHEHTTPLQDTSTEDGGHSPPQDTSTEDGSHSPPQDTSIEDGGPWRPSPPQETSTEDGGASCNEEEEVDVVQTSDTMEVCDSVLQTSDTVDVCDKLDDTVDVCDKLDGVLRKLEQNAPQELVTNLEVAP